MLFGRKTAHGRLTGNQTQLFRGALMEALEDRKMLSATVTHHVARASKTHAAKTDSLTASVKHASTKSTSTGTSSTSSGTTTSGFRSHGHIVYTLQFNQVPAAVQTGLTKLASSDSLAAPTS